MTVRPWWGETTKEAPRVGGMGHRLALNARGGSQGTVQARPAVWVRVSLTIGNLDRMHR